ncbi:MAG: acetolactate synthase [Eubacterium sp.]|nr:acetolactate synthase [Eubacterium sp.]
MSVKQISVFLENRPGTLEEMTESLAKNNLNIRAMSLAETKDFGIARLICDDEFEASNALKEAGFISSLTSVLAVEISDEIGALSKTLKLFAEGNINIEYMYAFREVHEKGYACMIFRVNDVKAAENFLTGKGVKLLDQEELAHASR